jgi:hypothetical protein
MDSMNSNMIIMIKRIDDSLFIYLLSNNNII